MTRELVSTHGQIAILLDGVVESAPAVQAAITNGQVQITGNYTVEEANALKTIIDPARCRFSLSIEQASTVGPTLGQQALWSGILPPSSASRSSSSGCSSSTRAWVFCPRLRFSSCRSSISACSPYSRRWDGSPLTLPGIAGIIVNIGMSADSSILIMECFHEQIREGKSVKTAATVGVKEGIFTSLDADVVTLVSAFILYSSPWATCAAFRPYACARHYLRPVVMALFSGPIMRILGPRVIDRHPAFWGIVDDVNEGEYIVKEAV